MHPVREEVRKSTAGAAGQDEDGKSLVGRQLEDEAQTKAHGGEERELTGHPDETSPGPLEVFPELGTRRWG